MINSGVIVRGFINFGEKLEGLSRWLSYLSVSSSLRWSSDLLLSSLSPDRVTVSGIVGEEKGVGDGLNGRRGKIKVDHNNSDEEE